MGGGEDRPVGRAPWPRGGARPGPAPQVAVHLAALAPLAVLIWDGVHDQLTANPIQAITFRTGKTALILLILSLACTPFSAVCGLRQAVKWRRPLGLYAFLYAGLHFLIFAVLDYGLDLVLLREAVFEKRYALVGFAALLLLIPLAITSTRGWMKRLGKRWKRLHQAVYVAGLLVIVHYVWLVKADRREPLLWGAAVGLLLLLRVPAVRRGIAQIRSRIGGPPTGLTG
jgi:sulfoxide reductase heme-binding subunit YedZ